MRRRLLRLKVWPALYAVPAALGVVQLHKPAVALGARHASSGNSAPVPLTGALAMSLGRASSAAFGRSGEVKVLFALPGQPVELPLDLGGRPDGITYEWTSLRGIEVAFDAQPVAGDRLTAPATPGFYYLTLVRGGTREVLSEPTVAVLRPFEEKTGPTLNGYRIGTYRAEKSKGKPAKEPPAGFVEVYPQHVDVPLSRHFRVRDFLTQDNQANVWPKYVALNQRLLDKLELVFSELQRSHPDSSAQSRLRLGVHSGFRTPAHNKRIRQAASDSRHQYGDAADVGIDADGNGRVDRRDWSALLTAIETVERAHPDLIGGLGVYNSRRNAAPYVHIDVGGKRARWRG